MGVNPRKSWAAISATDLLDHAKLVKVFLPQVHHLQNGNKFTYSLVFDSMKCYEVHLK